MRDKTWKDKLELIVIDLEQYYIKSREEEATKGFRDPKVLRD